MAIDLSDVYIAGFVTVIACFQNGNLAGTVAYIRRKHKIFPPETKGHPELERALRAQTNCVEAFGGFMGLLWMAAIFFHQVPAAIIGLLNIIFRHKYVDAYIKEAKTRVPWWWRCIYCMQVLLVMGMLGIVHFCLVYHAGINIKTYAWKHLGSLITPNKY